MANINQDTIKDLTTRIQDLYLADQIPWVIGYSGGKDSTAALQLVWNAVKELPVEQRKHKPIHVISTDTLVEQPIVATWVNQSLLLMREAAESENMPIQPHRLTPSPTNSYWVNLIGRGYPAPRQTFRWCTSRLKINPSNTFILNVVKTHGEAILVLGTRKAESAKRALNMNRYEKLRVREWLSPNGSLPNSLVFSPVEDWTSDDVWFYLLQNKNPWGRSNKDLMAMYRGASADNECPLVVDSSTPSCGNSRFGCWVCTLVTADRSMQSMIQNDEEKVWMMPLLQFRNELAPLDGDGRISDRSRRDYRRMDGAIKLNPRDGRTIPGPYTKQWREHLLRKLLEVEEQIRRIGPDDVRNIHLITDDELREIRRLWVLVKHEFDDALPSIYRTVKNEEYPYIADFESGPFGKAEWKLLTQFCGDDYVHLELQSSLLDVEQRAKGVGLRKSVTKELERIIKRCYYENEDDAIVYETRRQQLRLEPGQLLLDTGDFTEEGLDFE